VGGAGAVAALGVAAQVSPVRKALLHRIRQGDGPDEARRARSWFTVDFVGEAAGQTLHTRVSGGDPGYGETAKMLAESALCLALDDNPHTAGQVTTAQAMGDALTGRLVSAGLRFETL
jgi:saccharopine dehydrogenase (NAD+, L-glutamate forming)